VTNVDWHIVLRTGANVIWKSANSTAQLPVTGVTDLAWVIER
jgi:hypothetical protein